MPALDAVAGILSVLAGRPTGMPDVDPDFFAGEERLRANTTEMLGQGASRRPAHFLITVPSEAADDKDFMTRLAELGVEAVRINCAHNSADAWTRMIEGVDRATSATRRRMRVLMDLAGPKIRTGDVRKYKDAKRVGLGE